MTTEQQHPRTELDARYGDKGAVATPWPEAVARLTAAEIFWLTTGRPDGRPHVTPLIAVWLDGALHFCTGAEERKALNLAANPHCVLTTGNNTLREGYDLVVEGAAVELGDEGQLGRLADAYRAKYGDEWSFDVRDGAFVSGGHRAAVYRVAPVTAFGFGKGPYSQTRWVFDRDQGTQV
ncbi:pyridoxamine 5'-phosphate oxidase family protein [Streptomyces beijiangensis]|uniref:Pyridoxamine 5'-phosphate oxidase family protein n=1 Tax=Streptomyces beijiangensis TaxID=163361 RepID=A0A939F8Q4_9ACTN|nr:pyridoxamine 5'-phosphate oxidase family protein [Streptomyces beijiangensis]MBO0513973.1 pyridoxamine 5'-phosphate oxidase family protein [Streptomyces beijiangensis]